MKNKKHLILFLLIMIPDFTFSATEISVSYKDALQKIENNQGSVVDYYLVCLKCSDNFGGSAEMGYDLRLHLINKINYVYYTESLVGGGVRDDHEIKVADAIVDKSNRYIEINATHDNRTVKITAALFIASDKNRIFSLMYIAEDIKKIQPIRENNFIGGSFGDWYDMTDDILPQLHLGEFVSNAKAAKEFEEEVDWEFQFPRHGTTVQVSPVARYGITMSTEDQYNTFTKLMKQVKSLELKWDPESGKFIKGKFKKR